MFRYIYPEIVIVVDRIVMDQQLHNIILLHLELISSTIS